MKYIVMVNAMLIILNARDFGVFKNVSYLIAENVGFHPKEVMLYIRTDWKGFHFDNFLIEKKKLTFRKRNVPS